MGRLSGRRPPRLPSSPETMDALWPLLSCSHREAKSTVVYSHSPSLWRTLKEKKLEHMIDAIPFDFTRNLAISKDALLVTENMLLSGNCNVSVRAGRLWPVIHRPSRLTCLCLASVPAACG
jgi:hypothetical protein